ncbi:MAG TPA: aminotransferase class V-fold PLP-dependent enzyme [Candidatus Baltobacteraceae bacterium]|jgi:alanine-glyoxylate transaminase/serine-glyoxylate transaminase/serine-pyruvate transaminase
MPTATGRHFLQIPGPTNVPDRVLRAIDRPTIDHRGPEFAALGLEVLAGIKTIFQTQNPVIIYSSSGTGAWEAALVNTLSPSDKVLMFETGWFASLWREMAERVGVSVEFVPGDWRHGVDAAEVERRLERDTKREFKAVMVVHNETSTGVTTRIPDVRAAIDRTSHPALLMVDTISSLASIDYRHDEWGVDVTVGGSQKGLMLPPGLGFNAVSLKALDAAQRSRFGKSYWGWLEIIKANQNGFWPYTPSTNMLYGLREAIAMLHEEGLSAVFERHARHGEATRRAVGGWNLELLAADPREYSNSLTAIVVPDGVNADELRAAILDRYDMSLGTGLGRLKGKVFRIGHLGHFNDLMLAGTLCGVQMGLDVMNIPHGDGVSAALKYLSDSKQAKIATLATA